MSLYLDYRVQSLDSTAINISLEWHAHHALLAVNSFSQENGGSVVIYDELGEAHRDIHFPQNLTAQATSLVWHPNRRMLVTGWENGELRIWRGGMDFVSVQSPHQGYAITLLKWSQHGGRLVSTDTNGGLVGWKLDPHDDLLLVYHHTLELPLTHLVFRQRELHMAQVNISDLAKAAVAGDEKALDMFSAWRPRTAGHRFTLQPQGHDSLSFYVATIQGIIYFVSDTGSCLEVSNSEGVPIRKLLYYNQKDQLIVVTEGLSVAQYQTDAAGQVTELSRVKLSGRAGEVSMIWAGVGVLGVIVGDQAIRIWNIDTSENYLLPVEDEVSRTPTRRSAFTSLAYCNTKEILCVGSNNGEILMWKKNHGHVDLDEASNEWERLPTCNVHSAVKDFMWGPGTGQLAVNCITNVFILREQLLCAHYNQQVSAVQVSATALIVSVGKDVPQLDLQTDLQIKGVTVSEERVATWSGKTIIVYKLIYDDRCSISVEGTFSCSVESALLVDKSLVVLGDEDSNNGTTITVRTFQGTVKQILSLSDMEGKPLSMEANGLFLTVTTDVGYIKMWDFSRREAKVHGQSKDIGGTVSDFGEIILARSNCNGTKVSFTVAQSNLLPDSKVYVWDVDSDGVYYLNFVNGKLGTEEETDTEDGDVENAEISEDSLSPHHGLVGRFVLSHFWDEEEAKLLVCEAKRYPRVGGKFEKKGLPLWARRVSATTMTMPACKDNSTNSSKIAALQSAEVVVVTLLSSCDRELLIQDVSPLAENFVRLLGVHVPHYVMLRKGQDWKLHKLVEKVLMRDFEGLAMCDKPTREAIVNFSYFLTVGNMDQAFKVIKTIQSEAVWKSLARMCVKTRRLDVGAVCLGHMQHARGSRALRQAASEPELETRVAALAIQLGLLDEAERLYRSCGRLDLLNKMYQASDQWDKALAIAEEGDRIHLRSTYHNYAGVLESRGDTSGAAHMYHRADTHRHQVPKMLQQDPVALQQYTLKSKDPALIKWWAQYLESTGQMDLALKYYEEAQDHLSVVRVLCFQEEYEKAAKVANETSHGAACYHLARQYEAMEDIQRAVELFTRAKAYANAIRICKEHSLDEQLWSIALQANARDQIEAAQYFETSEPPASDKAILLYHRAGMLHKALDLAFRTNQFDALQFIAVDLTAASDPALIRKSAQFFVENEQYQKAVHLLAVGKMYKEAMELCSEHNIPLSDDLAERLSPEKGDINDADRVAVLEQLADCCLSQGNYHMATKKFTQAGNKVKAMKALLKSGDTEKIIFFANVSRQREIYVMAANYLQSMDWQAEPGLLKHIIAFYSKGKAPDLLANFYTACAQVEVDEYQNYEKALGALTEASRCLAKATPPKPNAMESLNHRIALVKKFLDAKRLFERGEAEVAINQCRQLLHSTDVEVAVRRGDVYCLLVAHTAKQRDWKAASVLIEDMRKDSGDNLAYYLPAELLELLASHGVNVTSKTLEPLVQSPGITEGIEEESEEIIEAVGEIDYD